MNQTLCFFVIFFCHTGTESSPFVGEESSISPNSRNIFYSSSISSHNTSENSNSNGQLITSKPTAVSRLFDCCHHIDELCFDRYDNFMILYFAFRTEVGHINGDQEGHAKIFHCTYQQRKHHDAVVEPAIVS